jgi:N-acetyl-alpha-D-muramate 1-phosphate uridylyltransferase
MKVMILAAGRGSRMRPITDKIPKPLLKIDTFSLIEHLLFRLSKHGFQDIVINLAHLGEKIAATLGRGERYGVTIRYSIEEAAEGLETGGGIFNALPLLGAGPFVVVSGDIWTDYNFSQLRAKPLQGLAHLVLVDNPPWHDQGDFVFSDGRLLLGEGTKFTFANIGVYDPSLFVDCQPGFFPLGPLLHKAVAEGLVTGEYYRGEWLNIGTADALQALRDKVKSC